MSYLLQRAFGLARHLVFRPLCHLACHSLVAYANTGPYLHSMIIWPFIGPYIHSTIIGPVIALIYGQKFGHLAFMSFGLS